MRTYSRKRPENQLIEGVESLCRLCLSPPEEAVPIFADNSENVCASLALRIMICVGLEMTKEDCLPNMVCCACLNELERYYTFRKKCEVSYQKLKSHVLAVKQKEFREQVQETRNETVLHLADDDIKVGTGNEMFTVTFDSAILLNEELPGLNGQGPLVTLTRIESNNRTHPNEIAMRTSNEAEITTDPVQSNDNNLQTQTKQLAPPAILQNTHELAEPLSSQTSQSDPDVPLSTILTNMLVDLGILARQGEHLVVVNPETKTVELRTEDGSIIMLELTEEGETEQQSSVESQLANNQEVKDVNQYINMSLNNTEKSDASKENNNKRSGSVAWCAQCCRTFASGAALRRHSLAVHRQLRPHACPRCQRRFAQREVLKRHQLVHQESRPFACRTCPKSFTQRAALAAHERSHAPPDQRPLRLHRCPHCPKVFLHASGLSRHSASHQGRVFGCGGCARSFSDRTAQRRHLQRQRHRPPGPPEAAA